MLLSVSYTFSACGTTADSSQKSKYFNDCIASPFFFIFTSAIKRFEGMIIS